jgi:SH3-domain binding protein 5
LEERLKKHIIKARPYFEEKELCDEQLGTQKARIDSLQAAIVEAKKRYSGSLRALEAISEEIHEKRQKTVQDLPIEWPVGPREPGVGAENDSVDTYSLEFER